MLVAISVFNEQMDKQMKWILGSRGKTGLKKVDYNDDAIWYNNNNNIQIYFSQHHISLEPRTF